MESLTGVRNQVLHKSSARAPTSEDLLLNPVVIVLYNKASSTTEGAGVTYADFSAPLAVHLLKKERGQGANSSDTAVYLAQAPKLTVAWACI